ncbi:MAG: heme-binding protein [Sulfuritalea sp.]|nr:heme-binding protein [Sulfuritalea sp.]
MCHDNILQYHHWRYNVSDDQKLSCFTEISIEGGVPIAVDGKIVGAIGVSGVTSQQDAQIAQAGADALK